MGDSRTVQSSGGKEVAGRGSDRPGPAADGALTVPDDWETDDLLSGTFAEVRTDDFGVLGKDAAEKRFGHG
jgi:hypothetical protein